MGSLPPAGERPHAVMMPYPAQGHVTPMLKLAKLLHTRGFHITFVNNEFNHLRLLGAQQSQAAVDRLCSLPGFRFATIADGLPPSDLEASRDTPALIYSTMTTCRPRFKELVVNLNEEAEASGGALPPVTCVVADSITSFAISVARELGLRCAVLWTASACGFMGYYHYKDLLDRGLVPLKEEAQLRNGYLDTIIDWIPAMPKDLRLRDLPSYLRTVDPDDIMFNFFAEQQTNCRFKCTEWGIGMEIGDDVRRTEVEAMIREAMEGEQGREMRRRVLELHQSAVASSRRDGRSMRNVDRLIKEVLLA
ncbi:unnamed protein product [Triticum turgidum subsp. durum]|uniref:Glycosyltransferase N-terminal domain-containing protein n=1 Tax=Triticum turgidum subsp. durum TaxID=4567 RepID=A0A9R0SRK3_TRITD|nr:unnamed protein product [Triticum turgidum subsp. durum]